MFFYRNSKKYQGSQIANFSTYYSGGLSEMTNENIDETSDKSNFNDFFSNLRISSRNHYYFNGLHFALAF